MNFCVIIPCYNHGDTLAPLLEGVPENFDVIVIDDGSDIPIKIESKNLSDRIKIFRSEKNKGKADALKLGFAAAQESGYTHAVTMDSDGQHPPEFLEKFRKKSIENPNAIILGVRDFDNSEIPRGRKFLNKFSNFWFKAETGIKVEDTQCGYRAYPLSEISRLNMNFGGFVFEVELIVKAAWAGLEICQIKIPAIYSKATLKKSHYRPVVDTLKFTAMNTKLFFSSLFMSKKFLKRIALKK